MAKVTLQIGVLRKEVALPTRSINPNLLQQHDCVIGILRFTEQNRVSLVAKIRSANGIETRLLKPLEHCVEID